MVRRIPLWWKVIFASATFGALLLLGLLIPYYMTNGIIEQRTNESLYNVMQVSTTAIESDLLAIERLYQSVIYNPVVQAYYANVASQGDFDLDRQITKLLINTSLLHDAISGIYLYDLNGELQNLTGLRPATALFTSAELSAVNTPRFSGMMDSASLVQLNDTPFKGKPLYAITVPIRQIDGAEFGDLRGWCVFLMSTDNFSAIFTGQRLEEGAHMYLLDGNDDIIACSSASLVGTRYLPQQEPGDTQDRYFYDERTIAPSQWRLLTSIPKDSLYSDLRQTYRMNSMISLTIIIAFVLVMLLSFASILTPLKRTMAFISGLPNTMGRQRLVLHTRNEMGSFAEKLNEMLDRIDAMEQDKIASQRTVYEMELSHRQVEMEALKRQINPHFLYNTLECVRGISLSHGLMDVADISTSLTKMFRYCMRSDEIVGVLEEVDNAHAFAHILFIRFGGRFRFEWNIRQGVDDAQSLKLLLQPLIENAVSHGLEDRVEGGTVYVDVFLEGDMVCYRVRDDGKGMEPNVLTALRQAIDEARQADMLSENDHIGLGNTARRLYLYYGSMASIGIVSEPRRGTQMEIRFPYGGDKNR